MFRMGAGRHFLKLEVKLYNRDFFLPLFPRPHYKYSWHLITIAGNESRQRVTVQTQEDRWQDRCCLNSLLHIQCTTPSGFTALV